MLESMRRSGASIFVYIIFGILILVFVLNFGPQANQKQGCGGPGANEALTVGDTGIKRASFAATYQLLNQMPERVKKVQTLEWLIRREILAQEGESRGLRIDEDAVDNAIKLGTLFFNGERNDFRTNGANSFFDKADDQYFFNYEKFQGLVRNGFQQSISTFKESQQREMLAALTADLIRHSVQVSREEAREKFIYEHDTVKLNAVMFDPADYRAAMQLTESDMSRFVDTHEAEVKAKYAAEERAYKGVKPQISIRQIFVAKPAAQIPVAAPLPEITDPVAKAAAEKAAADRAAIDRVDAEKKANAAFDVAVAKLTASRADIAAGKQTFASIAKAQSNDDNSKWIGGWLGWRGVESPLLADPSLNDAVKKLKPNEVSDVIKTSAGAYVLVVDGKREGDLSYEQVKNELAIEIAKDVWSKEAAKRAALAALAQAQAEAAKPTGGKSLDQLYEVKQSKAPSQQMTDEQMEQIKKMLEQQQLNGRSGSLPTVSVESEDKPASWATSVEAVGSAATPAVGSETPPVAPPAPPPVSLVATTEQLPAFGTVAKAGLDIIGPIPRSNDIAGFGEAPALVSLLFDKLAPKQLASTIFDARGQFAIVQLVERTTPEMKQFDKDADSMMEAIRTRRAGDAVNAFVKSRCEALNKAGKIKPAPELIREQDDQGKVLPTTYKPCMSMQ
jgi:parvulin-like peptidyl-prolyl isomerase